MARAEAGRRARGLAHPQLCLDAVQAGVERGGQEGLAAEGRAFAAAAALDTHKALVHIFFAQRATKKVKGVTDVPGECEMGPGGVGSELVLVCGVCVCVCVRVCVC